ncbi:hypothetical protein MMC18_004980 [Xylographa bjoerkii]|nr:hypothetical protein [Xylographa bjoerkii]
MWGQPINIEFRQEDLALFTTSALLTVSPSTSLSRTAGPSNTITQPYSAPTVIATPTSAPSVGLSTGAEAGIGIATGFSGLLILGAIVFVSIRSRSRRNRQPHAEGYTMQPHTGPWEFKELDGSEHYHMRELEGSQSRPPAEMFVSKAYSARTQELE